MKNGGSIDECSGRKQETKATRVLFPSATLPQAGPSPTSPLPLFGVVPAAHPIERWRTRCSSPRPRVRHSAPPPVTRPAHQASSLSSPPPHLVLLLFLLPVVLVCLFSLRFSSFDNEDPQGLPPACRRSFRLTEACSSEGRG